MSTVDDFDRLVEQQDQELAHDGMVSPSTRLRLEVLAQGYPLPPVEQSLAVQEATRRLKRSLTRFQKMLRTGGEEEDESCFTI